MKKLLFVLLTVFSLNTYALEGNLLLGTTTVASSFDSQGSLDSYTPSIAFEVEQGFVLANLGAGIAYNGNFGSDDVSVLPAYVFAKFNLFPVAVKPYLVAKAGTVLNTSSDSGKADGEAYLGAGVGIKLPIVSAELLYTKINMRDEDLNQIGLHFGINLF